MYDLISWVSAAAAHIQTLGIIFIILITLRLSLALDFMDVMGTLSVIGLIINVYV